MDEKMIIVLTGLLFWGHSWVSALVMNVYVKPGDNITIFCDCTLSVGTLVTWYRNCSHVHQPSLILRMKKTYLPKTPSTEVMKPLPRFQFVKNFSSDSYDLLITSITRSDEGLYFCGTEANKVEGEKYIALVNEYTYGNATTNITVISSKLLEPDPKDCRVCWILLVLLCPTFAILSSLISVLVICLNKDKNGKVHCDQNEITEARASKIHRATREAKTKDGDVCYAALEIRQASQQPKKSDSFCTYSAVRTSRE